MMNYAKFGRYAIYSELHCIPYTTYSVLLANNSVVYCKHYAITIQHTQKNYTSLRPD